MIQGDNISVIATETTNVIIKEVDDGLFAILVDEARDISMKEQMAIVLRFVDDRGFVIERFLGIVHVSNTTTALSLKAAIETLFFKHGLSISSLRGQCYNGASNMQGEFNGLKSLIMMENQSPFYIHCFAHQLQLTLVVVVENHLKIATFFETVTILSNVVGASCNRRDMLRDKQFEKVIQGIGDGEILTGIGLNQETTLKRAGDMRWGSHYGTLMSLIALFSSVIDVLLIIGEDGTFAKQRAQHKITIPNMEDLFVVQGKSGRHVEESTNFHYYRVELIYSVVDLQLQELDNHFNEVNTELLLCMTCLDPSNSFSTYDKNTSLQFAKFYPYEFPTLELIALEHQFGNYILDMRSNNQISEVMGVSELAKRLAQSKKYRTHPLVYLLVKLALLLPIATATIERVFSVMKIFKTQLRNRLGDDLMNDCLVTYIEKDVFETIDKEDIIQRFQNMKSQRGLL